VTRVRHAKLHQRKIRRGRKGASAPVADDLRVSLAAVQAAVAPRLLRGGHHAPDGQAFRVEGFGFITFGDNGADCGSSWLGASVPLMKEAQRDQVTPLTPPPSFSLLPLSSVRGHLCACYVVGCMRVCVREWHPRRGGTHRLRQNSLGRMPPCAPCSFRVAPKFVALFQELVYRCSLSMKSRFHAALEGARFVTNFAKNGKNEERSLRSEIRRRAGLGRARARCSPHRLTTIRHGTISRAQYGPLPARGLWSARGAWKSWNAPSPPLCALGPSELSTGKAQSAVNSGRVGSAAGYRTRGPRQVLRNTRP
jgi:hypothetical protein